MFVIEKNIPMPRRRDEDLGLPFDQMEVGDSFLAPDLTKKVLYNAANSFRKKTGKRFLLRTVEGGIRCWRVE